MTIDEAFNASVAYIWNRKPSTGEQPMTARRCWEISCNGEKAAASRMWIAFIRILFVGVFL
jgi:hypothetical protein